MPYPKVSAAEKYAEIGGRENAPKCKCHEVSQNWRARSSCRAGGSWCCAVKVVERSRRWKAAHPGENGVTTRRWRAKRKLAGLCVQCGEPNNNAMIRCDACRVKAADSQLRWYHTTAKGQTAHARRALRKAGRL